MPKPYQLFASGVIITEEGLMLSQYHVTHAIDMNDLKKNRKSGEKLKVILHDGKECEAELLGGDPTFDISLLRMTKPGPYPFTPLDPKRTVRLGDGVLKLGHPMGYRKDRHAVVRLGKILIVDMNSFVADCQIDGGDSGGPLFDLEGQLVGIIRNSGIPQPLHSVPDKPR